MQTTERSSPARERWAPLCPFDAGRVAQLRRAGLIGVDEAGRGPLAGPVCAAAVVLAMDFDPTDITDSKALSSARRARVAARIQQQAAGYGIGWASAREIDELNILRATHLAMDRALGALAAEHRTATVLVDGNRAPIAFSVHGAVSAMVKGDRYVAEISAASILAKTARDARMLELDSRYPDYEFARHKGYPTARHLARLEALGPCPEHRRSFGPVARAMAAGES